MSLPSFQTSYCALDNINVHIFYFVEDETLFISKIYLEKSDKNISKIVSEDFWEECMDHCVREYNEFVKNQENQNE
jgi:hypothetical protein